MQGVGVQIDRLHQLVFCHIAVQIGCRQPIQHIPPGVRFLQPEIPDVQLGLSLMHAGLEHRINACMVRCKDGLVGSLAGEAAVGKPDGGAQPPFARRVDDAGAGGLPDDAIIKGKAILLSNLPVELKQQIRAGIFPGILREVDEPHMLAEIVDLRYRRLQVGRVPRVDGQ